MSISIDYNIDPVNLRISQSQESFSLFSIVMVWAIFAPRFMFAAIFTVMGLVFWFFDVLLLQNAYSKVKYIGKEGRDN